MRNFLIGLIPFSLLVLLAEYYGSPLDIISTVCVVAIGLCGLGAIICLIIMIGEIVNYAYEKLKAKK
jgi:hypothetical protein